MAQEKLTDRPELEELVHDDDVVHVVDVSDTTDSAEGTSKKWKILKWLENLSNKSNDIATDASSTTKYPSVKAFKDYVDGSVAGLLDYRGGYDASGNTYPTTGGSGTAGAVLKGDMWIISVAGTLGGEAVQIGDSIIANTDTPGQTAGNWNHLNGNISYVPENVANKETTALDTSTTKYPCNNVVKEAVDAKQDSLGYTAENVANKKTSLTDNSDTYYPTQKAVKTAVDAKQDALGYTAENVANRLAAFQETPDDNHYISEKLAYNQLALKANLISPSFTTPNIGSATGSSLALEGTTLEMLSLKNTTPTAYTRMLFDGTGTDFAQGVGNSSASIADLQNKFFIYDFTNSKTAFTITPNTLAAKFYGSLEATNLSGTNTGDESDASTTVKGIVELAEASEVNTGTSTSLAITPDALAGSNFGTKTVQQYCVEWGTELEVADWVGYIIIPAECNGMNLISARADVITAGTTNASTFDIYNVTDETTMLSSAISIASGATSGTGTVDTAHDDVATGDIIRIDCNSISTIPPKGLIITLAFRL